jgi:SAM-dependent methyltransferase
MVSQGDLLAAAMLDEMATPIGQVSRAVADGDKMHLHAAGAYLYVGVLAVQLIQECLAVAGTGDVRRILDFGCGHGRVMRVLRPVFAGAELVACDLDQDAVRFCAEQFEAVPVHSSKDPATVPLDGSFDLIWSGSVLTHLDPASWKPVLSMLGERLDQGGVAVTSINGEPMTEVWEAGRWEYSLPPSELAELIAAYRERGAGYRPYPDRHEYGLSVCSVERMAEIASAAGLQVVLHMEGAWAPRRGTVGQDVVALTRK